MSHIQMTSAMLWGSSIVLPTRYPSSHTGNRDSSTFPVLSSVLLRIDGKAHSCGFTNLLAAPWSFDLNRQNEAGRRTRADAQSRLVELLPPPSSPKSRRPPRTVLGSP